MLGSCIGIVVALAFIGVGASIVRAAKPQSGYLMVAAGVLELLSTCCVGALYSQPVEQAVYGEALINPEHFTNVLSGFGIVAALVDLVVGVLLAVAIVGLAKAVREAKPG